MLVSDKFESLQAASSAEALGACGDGVHGSNCDRRAYYG